MSTLLLLLLSCADDEPVLAVPPAPAGEPVLVYTASVDGEIEPCG